MGGNNKLTMKIYICSWIDADGGMTISKIFLSKQNADQHVKDMGGSMGHPGYEVYDIDDWNEVWLHAVKVANS